MSWGINELFPRVFVEAVEDEEEVECFQRHMCSAYVKDKNISKDFFYSRCCCFSCTSGSLLQSRARRRPDDSGLWNYPGILAVYLKKMQQSLNWSSLLKSPKSTAKTLDVEIFQFAFGQRLRERLTLTGNKYS